MGREGLQAPASQVPPGQAARLGARLPLHVRLSSGVTFSDVVSATEPCKPCTECVGLQSMSAPCVEADDAVCRCAYGYYQDETTGHCEACRVCEAGSGLVFSCQDKQNTVCEECPDGTYSDEANHVDPCLPCTVCEDTERQLRECTRWADAECEGEQRRGCGRRGGGRPGVRKGLPWPAGPADTLPILPTKGPYPLFTLLGCLFSHPHPPRPHSFSRALLICGCRLGIGWVADEQHEGGLRVQSTDRTCFILEADSLHWRKGSEGPQELGPFGSEAHSGLWLWDLGWSLPCHLLSERCQGGHFSFWTSVSSLHAVSTVAVGLGRGLAHFNLWGRGQQSLAQFSQGRS